MYYIEDQDPILVKKEVIADFGRLKKLCGEVQARFGQYVHRSYDGMFSPYFQKSLGDDIKPIKNYVETKCEDGITLHFEYDEFVMPELVNLIGRLLREDAQAIDEIRKGPTQRCADSTGEKEQKELHKQLQDLLDSAPADTDSDRFWQLSEKIRRYYQEETQEEDWKELKEYYDKVLACLEFRPVKTLYKDKWNELRRVYKDVMEFYEGTGQFEECFYEECLM